MKKIYALCMASITCFAAMAQDTLYSENFETNPIFDLNTTDVGSTSSGINTWIINNDYTGGTINTMCLGVPSTTTVNNNPTQPAGIEGNPTSQYLHIASVEGISQGVSNNHYKAANALCVIPAENNFSSMPSDVSTIGYENVSMSFWWQCDGSGTAYGEVYYSLDSGVTWVLCTQPQLMYNDSANWVNTVISMPIFDEQPELRFGFRFVNGISVSGTNPAFGIDDIHVIGHQSTEVQVDPQDEDACDGSSATFSVTASNATTYQWQENQGLIFTNLTNTGIYSGVNTPTLTISSVNQGMAGWDYRCIVSGPGGIDTSDDATLDVHDLPDADFTIVSNPATIGVPVTFSVIQPDPDVTYTWDFCDGGSATGDTVTHTYAAVAVYTNCVCLTAVDTMGCGGFECEPVLTVQDPSGIEENETLHKIYPVPFSNQLIIEGGDEKSTYILSNAEGKIISSGILGNGRINTAQYAPGYYILQVEQRNYSLLKSE